METKNLKNLVRLASLASLIVLAALGFCPMAWAQTGTECGTVGSGDSAYRYPCAWEGLTNVAFVLQWKLGSAEVLLNDVSGKPALSGAASTLINNYHQRVSEGSENCRIDVGGSTTDENYVGRGEDESEALDGGLEIRRGGALVSTIHAQNSNVPTNIRWALELDKRMSWGVVVCDGDGGAPKSDRATAKKKEQLLALLRGAILAPVEDIWRKTEMVAKNPCGGLVTVTHAADFRHWSVEATTFECECAVPRPADKSVIEMAFPTDSTGVRSTYALPARVGAHFAQYLCEDASNPVFDIEAGQCVSAEDLEVLIASVEAFNVPRVSDIMVLWDPILGTGLAKVENHWNDAGGYLRLQIASDCEEWLLAQKAAAYDRDYGMRWFAPFAQFSLLPAGGEVDAWGNQASFFGGGNLEIGAVIGNGRGAFLGGIGGSSFYRSCENTGELGLEYFGGFRAFSGEDAGFTALASRYNGALFKIAVGESDESASARSSTRTGLRFTGDIHPEQHNFQFSLGVELAARAQVKSLEGPTTMFSVAPVIEIGYVGWNRDNPFRPKAWKRIGE